MNEYTHKNQNGTTVVVKVGDRVRIGPGVEIGDGVELETDVLVGPDSWLFSGVSVGVGTVIGSWTHLYAGVQVGRNCTIGSRTQMEEDVRVGNGCNIGNHVYLRRGVQLGEGVRIQSGSFLGLQVHTSFVASLYIPGYWSISMMPDVAQIAIGCEQHSVEFWRDVTDGQLQNMALHGPEAWAKYGDLILATYDAAREDLKAEG